MNPFLPSALRYYSKRVLRFLNYDAAAPAAGSGDDDGGEVLDKDKLREFKLGNGTRVVHADVSPSQIVKVYVNNTSPSDIVAEHDYINDEGVLEKSPKTVQLPRASTECLDLDGLQYTEEELNGYEVWLQDGKQGRKRKFLFLASVGTEMLKRTRTFT